MDNFDLRKYLVENKVTTNSTALKEEYDWEKEDAKDFANDPKALPKDKKSWEEYNKQSDLEKGTLVKFYTLTYDKRKKENEGVVSKIEGNTVHIIDFMGNLYKASKDAIGFVLVH